MTAPPHQTTTLSAVLTGFVRDPRGTLLARWNWKSAVMSSLVRGAIFFGVNVTHSLEAGISAFITELVLRSSISGFYGAITQNLSYVRPIWKSALGALVLLPIVNHVLEFVAHWARGTEKLWESIIASVCFTALSSLYHVFIMRRGVMIVGHGSQSLLRDLAIAPKYAVLFAAWPFTALYNYCKDRKRSKPSDSTPVKE